MKGVVFVKEFARNALAQNDAAMQLRVMAANAVKKHWRALAALCGAAALYALPVLSAEMGVVKYAALELTLIALLLSVGRGCVKSAAGRSLAAAGVLCNVLLPVLYFGFSAGVLSGRLAMPAEAVSTGLMQASGLCMLLFGAGALASFAAALRNSYYLHHFISCANLLVFVGTMELLASTFVDKSQAVYLGAVLLAVFAAGLAVQLAVRVLVNKREAR